MKNGMRVIDCEHHFNLNVMMEEWRKTMTPEEWKGMGGDVRFDHPTGEIKKLIRFRS